MPNLTMLLGNSNVYAYQDRTLLPGRLLGTVVRSELYELVLAAEQIIRRYALNAKLMILDSARPRITQAALHLNACRVLYSSVSIKIGLQQQLPHTRLLEIQPLGEAQII